MKLLQATISFTLVNQPIVQSSQFGLFRINFSDFLGETNRERRLRDEKAALVCEMQTQKARNSRLIEQLREKSAQLSRLQAQNGKLEQEVWLLVGLVMYGMEGA